MTKILFFILTTLFFLSTNSFAVDCSSLPITPKITITSSYGKLTYDYSKNISEITAMAKKFNLVETGLFASGLSTVNVNFDITINSIGQPIGNSEYCVIPTEVVVFLGLEAPTIYISKDLNKDSCEYKQVLHHEKIHQQINKTTLEYYLPMFKKASTEIINKTKAVHTSSINNIEKITGDLTKYCNKKLTPLVNFIKKEMLSEQQKLDSSDNYLYENNICQTN